MQIENVLSSTKRGPIKKNHSQGCAQKFGGPSQINVWEPFPSRLISSSLYFGASSKLGVHHKCTLSTPPCTGLATTRKKKFSENAILFLKQQLHDITLRITSADVNLCFPAGGLEYPSCCSKPSAAFLFAIFLFGPEPTKEWSPIVTYKKENEVIQYIT